MMQISMQQRIPSKARDSLNSNQRIEIGSFTQKDIRPYSRSMPDVLILYELVEENPIYRIFVSPIFRLLM